jgi:uncharacterized Zn finger protein
MRRAEPDKSGWGARWLEAVANFSPKKQLERGHLYAKSGKVLSLQVDQGFAAAEVEGPRTRPCKVEIGLPMFTRKQCARAVDALLKQALYTAKLLAGDMPRDLEKIFADAGAALLPTSAADISSDCSCFDMEDPCKHVAAVYVRLAHDFDANPFLLLEMRGLTRAQLLMELQTRRSTRGKSAAKRSVPTLSVERPVQTYLAAHLNDFFQAAQNRPFTALPSVDDAAPLITPGLRIQEMGSPPFWQSDNDFEEVLVRIYQAVRSRAIGS